jgi:hypothetical protein
MHNFAQFVNHLQHRLVDNNIGLRVQEQSGLLTNGFDHLRVAVTGIRHADSASEIEIFFAICSIDIAPFGPLRLNRENPRPDGGHVGEVLVIEFSHKISLANKKRIS